METQQAQAFEEGQHLEETQDAASRQPAAGLAEGSEELLDAVIEESLKREANQLRIRDETFKFQQRRAAMYWKSALFTTKEAQNDKDIGIAQAMVKIELGESMGFGPAEALQGIHVINGATAIAAQLRAARMQAAGFSWDIQWIESNGECEGCRLWLKFRGKPMMQAARDPETGAIRYDEQGHAILEQVTVAFLKRDAEKMLTTLWEGGNKRRASILEKENWKMSPRNMYFARAITNAQRFHAPGVLSINLPSIEEALDMEAQPNSNAKALGAGEELRPGSKEAAQGVAIKKIAAKSGYTEDQVRECFEERDVLGAMRKKFGDPVARTEQNNKATEVGGDNDEKVVQVDPELMKPKARRQPSFFSGRSGEVNARTEN